MKYLLGLFLLLVQPVAMGANLKAVFGDGVFNTKWGYSLEQVQKVYPNAKVEKYGDLVQVVLKDGREVLGITRSKSDVIRFGFDSESRLIGVVVYFDADEYGNILNKLTTTFGQPLKQAGNYATVQWPNDENISIFLSIIPSGFSNDAALTISNSGLSKPSESKESLGF